METVKKDSAWLELYREAILENDPEVLMDRLLLARKAIQERTRDLWYRKSPEASERQRLTAAAHYLEILRSLAEKKRGIA